MFSWQMLPCLLRARRNGALVSTPDGRLIIMGGYNAEADSSIDIVECLSLNAPHVSWRNIAPLPQPICASGAVYFQDVVIIAGGQDKDGRILSTVYALKPPRPTGTINELGQWTKLSAELPSPSCVNCICRVGEELFTFREFNVFYLLKRFTSRRLWTLRSI